LQYPTLGDIIGCSPALGRIREIARQAAQHDTAVLIVGEQGSGKTLLAAAIHAGSPHRHGPFVSVECAALSWKQLQATLLGETSRTRMGAAGNGTGRTALAEGGTLCLEEIGELPPHVQLNLLRLLQERRLRGASGGPPKPVRCAVIASSQYEPGRLVEEGRLRRDLWYRLDIVHIALPPLRERPEDIALLLGHYWRHLGQEFGATAQLSSKALGLLQAYPWPGNVHELIEVVQHLLQESRKLVIEPEDLPRSIVSAAERSKLERALNSAQGNRTKAARLLGVTPAKCDHELREHGVIESDVVSGPP
jgi:transcriptional regulator with PAS, ATPase and Fis domain